VTPAPTAEGGGRRRVEALAAVLERQRRRDLLGPEGFDAVVAHSRGFAALVGDAPRSAVDLGSGGGVPGLVLAVEVWPRSELVLVDASQRRCTYLELEVAALGVADRVAVRWGRAEDVGRDPVLRGSVDVVTARCFGPPGVTAECAAPLLRPGGVLLVSEPPRSRGERWPAAGLARAGMAMDGLVEEGGSTYARLRQVAPCPDALPRRPGVPERRPLF
jgi:16S rRNA (guanine527-N7)-methyltransferase